MATLTAATYAAAAIADVVDLFGYGSEEMEVPLSDGGHLTVRVVPDESSRLDDYEQIAWEDNRTRERPAGFDGGAVKLQARSGMVWYQPPRGLTGEQRAAAIARARDYFLEGWDYVGVVVTRHAPPIVGPFGGTLEDKATESLWAIESDAGGYLVEVAGDLAHELGCSPA